MIFRNRYEAGRQLAQQLHKYRQQPNTLVLGLPRGGVVTAAAIADTLQLSLDVMITRKIGAPENPEFAIGAVTEEGDAVLNDAVITLYNISETYIEQQIKQEQAEIARRKKLYRVGRPELDLQKMTILLVDDGIATGYTMRAAILSAETKGAAHVIVVVPVIATDTAADLQMLVDEIVSLHTPTALGSVGSFYEEFDQVSDAEVIKLMQT